MRRIDCADRPVIGLLRSGKSGTGSGLRLFGSLQFTLVVVGLPLRRCVGIAQIQHILLGKLRFMTRLLQLAMGHAGAVLPLLHGAAGLFNRQLRLCLRPSCCQREAGKNP